jgi:hypothetical protein
MQGSESDTGSGNMFSEEPTRFPVRQGSGSSSSTLNPDVIQQSGPGRYSLTFVGSAVRAGYQIPRPKVNTIGGQTPVETDAQYISEQLGVCFGIPVYRSSWAINYELAGVPSSLTPPAKLEA